LNENYATIRLSTFTLIIILRSELNHSQSKNQINQSSDK
jgi:hypothetical protein